MHIKNHLIILFCISFLIEIKCSESHDKKSDSQESMVKQNHIDPMQGCSKSNESKKTPKKIIKREIIDEKTVKVIYSDGTFKYY